MSDLIDKDSVLMSLVPDRYAPVRDKAINTINSTYLIRGLTAQVDRVLLEQIRLRIKETQESQRRAVAEFEKLQADSDFDKQLKAYFPESLKVQLRFQFSHYATTEEYDDAACDALADVMAIREKYPLVSAAFEITSTLNAFGWPVEGKVANLLQPESEALAIHLQAVEISLTELLKRAETEEVGE